MLVYKLKSRGWSFFSYLIVLSKALSSEDKGQALTKKQMSKEKSGAAVCSE